MQRDFPPLLDPGFHDLDLKQVEDLCVTAFGNNDRRKRVWERFNVFLDQLRSTGIDYELWLDGSFLTEKSEPGDIDVAVLANPAKVNSLPVNHRATLERIFIDSHVTKLRYLTHAFFVLADDQSGRAYWSRWFGHDRSGTPKGIVKLSLSPSS